MKIKHHIHNWGNSRLWRSYALLLSSTLVSNQSPLSDNSSRSAGIPPNTITSLSFHQISLLCSTSSWLTEEAKFYGDGTNKNAFKDCKIDLLEMRYHDQVFVHISAGHEISSILVSLKPVTWPNPPYKLIPTGVSLTSIASSQVSSDKAIIGMSLKVRNVMSSCLFEWSI